LPVSLFTPLQAFARRHLQRAPRFFLQFVLVTPAPESHAPRPMFPYFCTSYVLTSLLRCVVAAPQAAIYQQSRPKAVPKWSAPCLITDLLFDSKERHSVYAPWPVHSENSHLERRRIVMRFRDQMLKFAYLWPVFASPEVGKGSRRTAEEIHGHRSDLFAASTFFLSF
jgi:hypothetical protein